MEGKTVVNIVSVCPWCRQERPNICHIPEQRIPWDMDRSKSLVWISFRSCNSNPVTDTCDYEPSCSSDDEYKSILEQKASEVILSSTRYTQMLRGEYSGVSAKFQYRVKKPDGNWYIYGIGE